MTDYTLTAAFGAPSLTGEGVQAIYGEPTSDYMLLYLTQAPSYGVILTDGPIMSNTVTPFWQWGPTVADTVLLSLTQTAAGVFASSWAEAVQLAGTIAAAFPTTFSDTATFSQVVAAAYGLTILQQVKVTESASGAAIFGLPVSERVLVHDLFGQFLGAAFSDTARLTEAYGPGWAFAMTATDHATLSAAAANSLIVTVNAADGVQLSEAELLHMIFSGSISDGLDLSVAYISPNNDLTTWAINTRTTAVTEYQNFAFVSYIQMGRKYLGLSSSGLYELDGATDSGQNVVGKIASGMLQMGDSHYTSFKAAYLGTRQSGDFVLKLITGTGLEYRYAVRSRPMQTTRVMFGKGLRSRYFKFELEAIDGHDFDLDNIEFMPLVSQRRVD